MSALFSLERWRPKHLLAAWVAWWAGLVGVTLGSAIVSIVRVTGDAAGKGSVNAGYGDGAFTLDVIDAGTTAWSGTASLTSVVLWVAGPPLLLWLAWLFTRPRRHAAIPGAADDMLLPPSGVDLMARRREHVDDRDAR